MPGIATADPFTAFLDPNYMLPGLPGLTADDSVAAKQAALRSAGLAPLATIVRQATTELNAGAVLLATGSLTAGLKRVRLAVRPTHLQGGVAAADNKGLVLFRRSSVPADVEQLMAVQVSANGRGMYFEGVVNVALNDTIQLRVDTVNMDVGTEVAVLLEVTDAASNS